jgi:hypothetical protein
VSPCQCQVYNVIETGQRQVIRQGYILKRKRERKIRNRVFCDSQTCGRLEIFLYGSYVNVQQYLKFRVILVSGKLLNLSILKQGVKTQRFRDSGLCCLNSDKEKKIPEIFHFSR